MKKIIILLVLIFCFIPQMWSQNVYYYYNGNKKPLNENQTKFVSILPKTENVTLPASSGLMLTDTISDEYSFIRIYEADSSESINESITTSLVTLQPCYKTEEGFDLIPNGYINVKLKSDSDYSLLQSISEENGCIIVEQNPFMPLWYNLRVNADVEQNSVEIANDIYETGLFAASFPSFSVNALEISYDPNVYEQWGLYNSEYEGLDVSVGEAWNYATGNGIIIAIIDQGIDMNHQDLSANIYHLSYDTETNTSPSMLYGEHGTHCAGIAAAVRNNGIQIAGVAPDAKLMSISNRLATTINYESNIANGINWAWMNGADIISCSWWCNKNELVDNAIAAAVTQGREDKGCVFVKSAGNTSGAISYPGDYGPDVLAVANMTANGTLESFSAHGPNLFVTAPGTNILSTLPNNKIGKMTGTSMACPHVAGVAALILERNPQLTAEMVRKIIAENAKKVGSIAYDEIKEYGTWNEYYGYGLVDAAQSVINTPRH